MGRGLQWGDSDMQEGREPARGAVLGLGVLAPRVTGMLLRESGLHPQPRIGPASFALQAASASLQTIQSVSALFKSIYWMHFTLLLSW